MLRLYKTLENITRKYVPLALAGLFGLGLGNKAYTQEQDFGLKISSEKVILSNTMGIEGGSFGLSYNPRVIKIINMQPSGILASLPLEDQVDEIEAEPWTLDYTLAMPETRTGISAAKDLLGRVYVIGGGGSRFSEAVLRFEESSGQWDYVAGLSTPRAFPAVAADHYGRIYAIGGHERDGSWLSSVERYIPNQDRWEAIQSLPEPRVIDEAVTSCDGYIYVFGGLLGQPTDPPPPPTNTVLRYDVDLDQWFEAPIMLYPRVYHAAALGRDCKIYAIGGISDWGYPTNAGGTVERYDPKTDIWEQVASMNSHPHQIGSGVADECGFIYVMGGWNPGYTNAMERYDISKDKWKPYPSLNQSKNNMGAIFANSGRIYVFGGDADFTEQNTVEYSFTGCKGLSTSVGKPEYLQVILNPMLNECNQDIQAGVAVAWINSLSRVIEIPPGTDQEIFKINWLPNPSARLRDYSPINFINCLKARDNSPTIETLLNVKGQPITPRVENGQITLRPFFRRGDVYEDRKANITDAIKNLRCLFLSEESCPECQDVMDVDDNGGLGINDAIYFLNWMFSPEPFSTPPAPGPLECGLDFTSDNLNCENPQQTCLEE